MTMKRSCDQCMHCRYIAKGDVGHYCFRHRECMTADQVDTLGCDEFWPRAIIGQPTCDTCRFCRASQDVEPFLCTVYDMPALPDFFCDDWRMSDTFERTGKRLAVPCACDDKLGPCECE